MIQTIEYNFSSSERNPYLHIKIEAIGEEKKYSDPYLLNTELNQLSSAYLQEIVENLEQVMSGEKDYYHFGYETTFIWCYQKGKSYYGEKYPNTQVSIAYDYADKNIPTELKVEEILTMMRERKEYVEAWEKQHGKIKK